jgi:hypothetical protein
VAKRSKSIVVQLTTWYVSSLFVIVFFSTSYLYWTLSSAITAENRAILQDRLQTVTSLVKRGESESLQSAQERIKLEWPSRQSERIFVRVRDSNGEILLESPLLPAEVLKEVFPRSPLLDLDSKVSSSKRVRTLSGGHYLTTAQMVSTVGRPPATVFVALDLALEESILASYRNRLLAVLAFALFISALLGRKLAIAAFHPVEKIVNTTRRIRFSTLHERIDDVNLPRELVTMASTVNEMLDRLEDSFQ